MTVQERHLTPLLQAQLDARVLKTDGEPCHAFAAGDGSRSEIHEMGLEQSTGGSRAYGLADSMSLLQQSEAAAPRSKIVVVPSYAPRCSGPTASRLSAVDYPSTNEFWHWDEIHAEVVQYDFYQFV